MPTSKASEREPVRFRVDTHVFRELGAFLVGRDSTALAELIKNSYDADATDVFVNGANLRDAKSSRIIVTDNGTGMTMAKFQSGFLTIASRSKSAEERYTATLGRRFTGAKGIGRLAAHKLASILTVESLPDPDANDGETTGVFAVLDWDAIEEVAHVDELASVLQVGENNTPVSATEGEPWGTRVILERLRRPWTDKDISDFTAEVQGYEPPEPTYAPNAGEIYVSPLFRRGLTIRGQSKEVVRTAKRRNVFNIHLEGDFAVGEPWSPLADDAAHYVLEIDSSSAGVRYGVARTKAGARGLPETLQGPPEIVETKPSLHRVHFQARVFMRSGRATGWNRALSGVRVYLEGFRVLPYGEQGDDWLGTDAQYVKRGRDLVSLGEKFDDSALFGTQLPDEGLSGLPATGYIGAVFLTEEDSGDLQMLVNREGFVPGPAFEELTHIVRRGIDLSTRVRARDAASKRRRGRPTSPVTRERSAALVEQVRDLKTMVAELHDAQTEPSDPTVTIAAVARVAEAVSQVSIVTTDLLDELNMIRVLASVGTQLAAFVHELRGLLGIAQRLQEELKQARSHRVVSPQLVTLLDDLKRGLERQASFLDDVTSIDARRRRSAQKLADRVKAAVVLLSDTAARRHVTFQETIDERIRTRPMFRAELMAILSNLFTNAVRAATPDEVIDSHRKPHQALDIDIEPGVVAVEAQATEEALTLFVSNTGKSVDLVEAEQWFEPYASTSNDSDQVLGKGTGLGLTITRALVSENAGTIKFIQPREGYATTICVTLPNKRSRARTGK